MKSMIVIASIAVSSLAYANDAKLKPGIKHPEVSKTVVSDAGVKLDFQSISVSQVIGLVYMEALKQAYVIDPAVLRDERLVSFRFDASKGDLRAFWLTFLDSLDFKIETRTGVDYLTVKKPLEDKQQALDFYVYRPQYRQVSYLVGLLTPLFTTGGFTVNRSVKAPAGAKSPANNAPTGSAAATIDQDSDTLVFQGTPEELNKLKKVLPQVDVPAGEVVVKAIVYEVTTGNTDGSAFALALNVLGGKFGITIAGASQLANSVSIRSTSIESAFSALAGDNRFKAISKPHLRVKSGAQAHLTVGQDVPTLGAVSYPQGAGQPVQSVEYRSSGVILNVSPVVRESSVDMTIEQQISDFAKTETGVSNSPTLTKRQLSTSVSVTDGELILIGGLTQEKNTDSHSGLSFLPAILHSKSNAVSSTELLLVLQISRVGAGF
jgi:type II secretory pathway component GspD/PulD (secretin)